MKTALPENAKIAKEAKECMQECVSEFISFITSEGQYRSLLLASCNKVTDALASLRKMPAGEAQDRQRRGYSVRYDVARVRELC